MKTVRDFATAKQDRRKIVVSTAYDAWSARLRGTPELIHS
jgi:ketopantoate hydroxymethyltransferase